MIKICIIGAGPAGLMAAGTAAQNKENKIYIFEKNDRIGKKLLITGKGRCNVTNNCDVETALENVVSNKRFLYSAFNSFTPSDTMAFFTKLGVELKTERGNRVFPQSDRSNDILSALKKYINKNNITIVNTPVKTISKTENGFLINGKEEFDKVLISTGGLSYSLTGSTGDGYCLAKSLGHTVTPLGASLVPLVCENSFCAQLSGLSLKNVTVSLFEKSKGKELYSELGEMLFTHFGVSGPLILSASSHMKQNLKYTLKIDLKPGLSYEKLENRVLRDFEQNKNKELQNALRALLPSSLIPVVIKEAGLDCTVKINSFTKEMRKKLIECIKGFTIDVKGFRPVEEAIITTGGINVKEIDPKTMQSKLVKDLYFAGEIIDVDAYTGGFNLQIAFSTGYLAGKAMEI